MINDIFRGHGVKVELLKPDSFAIAMETLTRIGIPSKGNKLIQTCHILHKSGEYAIVHFKELFKLDGKDSELTEEDIMRRNRIVSLLQEWGIIKISNPEDLAMGISPMNSIKVVSHKDKHNWTFEAKYTIGKSSKKEVNGNH